MLSVDCVLLHQCVCACVTCVLVIFYYDLRIAPRTRAKCREDAYQQTRNQMANEVGTTVAQASTPAQQALADQKKEQNCAHTISH